MSLIIRTQPLAKFDQHIYFPNHIRAKYNIHVTDNKFIRLIKYLFCFNVSESWNVLDKYIEMNIKLYPNKVLLLLVLLYEYWQNDDNRARLATLLCKCFCGQEIYESLNAFIYYKLHSKDKKNIGSNFIKDRLHLACQSLSFGNKKWFEKIDENVKNLL